MHTLTVCESWTVDPCGDGMVVPGQNKAPVFRCQPRERLCPGLLPALGNCSHLLLGELKVHFAGRRGHTSHLREPVGH